MGLPVRCDEETVDEIEAPMLEETAGREETVIAEESEATMEEVTPADEMTVLDERLEETDDGVGVFVVEQPARSRGNDNQKKNFFLFITGFLLLGKVSAD